MRYCEEYAALLDLYVDGELSPQESARVLEHLDGCPGCRAYVEDALAIRAAFGELEEAEPPEGFAAGVMAEIRAAGEKEPPARERPDWKRWKKGAAVPCGLLRRRFAAPVRPPSDGKRRRRRQQLRRP